MLAGFAGSRSGALIATAWASLVHMGEEGYLSITQKMLAVGDYSLLQIRPLICWAALGLACADHDAPAFLFLSSAACHNGCH